MIIIDPDTNIAPHLLLQRNQYLFWFLAGGITNCPDHQATVIDALQKVDQYAQDPVVICNPRKKSFDITDPTQSVRQIAWEHAFLSISQVVSFWFCESPSNQPIALFELGKYIARNPKGIVVGCDPKYSRRFDVIEQCNHEEIVVEDTLDDLIRECKYKINAFLTPPSDPR